MYFCYLRYYAEHPAVAHGFSWPYPCLGPLLMSKGMDMELTGISYKTPENMAATLRLKSLATSPGCCGTMYHFDINKSTHI